MSATINIREARVDDADRIAELAGQLGYPSCPNEMHSRLNRLANIPDQIVFAAEMDRRIVGWLHVGLVALVETNGFAEIFGLVVDEKRRGEGIGKQLISAAEKWASSRGQLTLRVRSNVIREESHGFYRRRDFREIKRQVVFEKDLRAS